MIASAIPDAIRPYSMAVAPESSRRKRRNRLCIAYSLGSSIDWRRRRGFPKPDVEANMPEKSFQAFKPVDAIAGKWTDSGPETSTEIALAGAARQCYA